MDANRAFRLIYKGLHRVASGKENSPSVTAELNIVDTVLLDQHLQPNLHLFTSKQGVVQRKKHKNVNWSSVRNAIRRSSKLYPAKYVAILRFSDPMKQHLQTHLVSTSKSFDNIEHDLGKDIGGTLECIQMYSHELANPGSGVFHCNYTCTPTGSTKYTSVQVKVWPEKEEEGEEGGGETENGDDRFVHVAPWRHNTMVATTRSIVSFVEKTHGCKFSSTTLEFVFDPSTAQPVLLGVVEGRLGGKGGGGGSPESKGGGKDRHVQKKKEESSAQERGGGRRASFDKQLMEEVRQHDMIYIYVYVYIYIYIYTCCTIPHPHPKLSSLAG